MGRKRHVLSDTLGLPLVFKVDSAGIQDREGFALVGENAKGWFRWLRIVFADAAYNAIQNEYAAAQDKLRLEIIKRPRDAGGSRLLSRSRCGHPTVFSPGVG